MIINNTPKCKCGKEKSTKTQWCNICYNKLPRAHQDRYAAKLKELGKLIAELDGRMFNQETK